MNSKEQGNEGEINAIRDISLYLGIVVCFTLGLQFVYYQRLSKYLLLIPIMSLILMSVLFIRQCAQIKELAKSMDRLSEKTVRVKHIAMHDELTGLPNRREMHSRFKECIHNRNVEAAVLFVDLDNFKSVNDRYGHYIGDIVLKRTATRLRNCARDADWIFRFGGDEFIVFLLDQKQNQQDVEKIADRFIVELSKPFDVENKKVMLTASIGISMLEKSCNTLYGPLRDADIAMYHAKRTGGNKFHLYS